jgi:hypothetical protein
MFLAKPMKGYRTKYRRAEALRFAVEESRIPKAYGAWLEVGDERFNSTEIQRLYEAADYPLRSLSDRASAPRVRVETDGRATGARCYRRLRAFRPGRSTKKYFRTNLPSRP